MKRFWVNEAREFANALVPAEYTDEIRTLLSRLEDGEIAFEKLLEQVFHYPVQETNSLQ